MSIQPDAIAEVVGTPRESAWWTAYIRYAHGGDWYATVVCARTRDQAVREVEPFARNVHDVRLAKVLLPI